MKASPVDEAIMARIKALVPKLQGRVYEGDVPEGEKMPLDPMGNVVPYCVYISGGVFRPGQRMRGITSSRDDNKYHTNIILVHASTAATSRELADDVRDALEGYEPPGGTEMYEETSGNAKYPADATLKPVRYTSMLAFALLLNQ